MTGNLCFDLAIIWTAFALFWGIVLFWQRFTIDPVPQAKKQRMIRIMVFNLVLALALAMIGVII